MAQGFSWLASKWPQLPWDSIVRFFKYSVLLVGVLITLRVVFDGYSYYIARRALDAELEAKKIPSLEYLMLLSQRDRALTLASYETRCQERMQLALFRIVDGMLASRIRDASQTMFEARSQIVNHLRTSGASVLTKAFLDDLAVTKAVTLSVNEIDHRLGLPASWMENVKNDDPALRAVREQFIQDKRAYEKAALTHATLVDDVRNQLKSKTGSEDISLQSIRTLEDRLERLKQDRERNKLRLQDLEEVLTRYESWTAALTTRGEDRALLDEIAYQVDNSQQTRNDQLNCDYADKFYQAVTDRLIKRGRDVHASTPTGSDGLTFDASELYHNMLARYFKQPPAAQTLFVTLLIGALGALTLNVLRLSKVGWWATYHDPDWGEILVSPLLGALAAFGIYLVGSAGLLLTSDVRNGGSALSTAFIGLLGFVSGLLYDEAFGRVRRVGSRIFSGDATGDDGTGARPEDLALAKALQAANASLMGSLVLKYNVGLRLARETSFTLLVPSDQAIGSLNLKAWTDINDRQKDLFDKWFKHHHAPKTLFQKDVPAGAPVELNLDDSSKVSMTTEAGVLKVAGVPVLISDIAWEKGVIHVLSATLP